jgi:hypothetical protein
LLSQIALNPINRDLVTGKEISYSTGRLTCLITFQVVGIALFEMEVQAIFFGSAINFYFLKVSLKAVTL